MTNNNCTSVLVPAFFLAYLACLLPVDLQAADELPALFPFVISHEAPDNVTSMAHLLEAPAGKHGFVRVEDGRFATDAGPIKFNAVNLTGAANFPSHEDADRLADRLARFGINCVRLHYFDAPYGNFREEAERGIFGLEGVPAKRGADPAAPLPSFDPEALDRMDYLIAALKKRGIYLFMDLHVSRFDKGFSFISDAAIASEKEYARRLLTHVNPYTGLAYIDEPAIAMIGINNENSLFMHYVRRLFDKLPEPYALEFRLKWNTWLKHKYGSDEAMWNVWGVVSARENLIRPDGAVAIIGSDEEGPLAGKRDYFQFLVDTERSYWRGMSDYITKELKAKVPVAGSCIPHSWPYIQNDLDFVDTHNYWMHPAVGKSWRIGNTSMVNSMDTIIELASRRVHDTPYTVSEYNHPFPNQFGAEGQPMLRAYGALQGWDGVFAYTWHHRQQYHPGWNSYFFSISERTDVLAHLQACAAMFLRGDVREAGTTIAAAVDYDTGFDRLVAGKSGLGIDIAGFHRNFGLIHKTGVDLRGSAGTDPSSIDQAPAEAAVVVSDTAQLTWNREVPEAGYFTVNTPDTKLFSGFPNGRTIALGEVSLKIGLTRLNWATVSLTSRFAGGGFGENDKPAQILLAATGMIKNTGQTWETFDDGRIGGRNADWGRAPVLAEGIPVVIELPSPAYITRCFALDPNGDRVQEVPVEKIEGVDGANGCRIVIGPQYQTIWYEIEIAE